MRTNKLQLPELQVESFATQISEKEMIDLKGGTSQACVLTGVDIALALIGWWNSSSQQSGTSATITTQAGDSINISTHGGDQIDEITIRIDSTGVEINASNFGGY